MCTKGISQPGQGVDHGGTDIGSAVHCEDEVAECKKEGANNVDWRQHFETFVFFPLFLLGDGDVEMEKDQKDKRF